MHIKSWECVGVGGALEAGGAHQRFLPTRYYRVGAGYSGWTWPFSAIWRGNLLVSRFFAKRIQMNFAENKKWPSNPAQRRPARKTVAGHMRRGVGARPDSTADLGGDLRRVFSEATGGTGTAPYPGNRLANPPWKSR
jgi:hypothetical protein